MSRCRPIRGTALALAVTASLHLAIFPQAIRLSNQPTTRYRAVLVAQACRGCPLREPCTASPDGLTLRLHEHDAILGRTPRDGADDQQLHDTAGSTGPW